jgi:folate-binding protein YgfZ
MSTEEVRSLAVSTSPLAHIHRGHGAVMRVRDDWSMPASYGDTLFEYAVVRERGVGLIDLSSRGRLLVSGSEAVPFLNGLITNDMKTLAENRWMPAAFPNVQGRLIASGRVIRSRDDTSGKSACPVFLIDTEATTTAAVVKTLSRFALAGDFRVKDMSGETALISIQGVQAANVIRAVFDGSASMIERFAVSIAQWQNAEVTVVHATHTAEDGFDLFLNANTAPSLWEALRTAGARPVGLDAWEILRIEAGEPRHGVDMDESNVVTETNLDDAVSFTKGCYIGQEIIARIKYRGHVAKKLTGLMFDRGVPIKSGAKIKSSDDKEIGRITSTTVSPHLGRTIALGYLKYNYLAGGTEVNVTSGEIEHAARVVDLPFVRGSWHSELESS